MRKLLERAEAIAAELNKDGREDVSAFIGDLIDEIAQLREERESWHSAAKLLAESGARRRMDDGCPVCSGDCAGANPPVMNCPLYPHEGGSA